MSGRQALAFLSALFLTLSSSATPLWAQVILLPPPPPGPGGARIIGFVYPKRPNYPGGYGLIVEQRVVVRQPVVLEPYYEYDLRGIDLDVLIKRDEDLVEVIPR